VTGVEWLLREALVNLMDNAIKYTPEEGAITLRIERTPGGMVLSVRDTGPGMTETDIRKAGRRFRRGQAGKRGHGAGLGLAIVHTIMQRHGGALRIEPASPGVRVSLVFPGDQGFPGKSPACTPAESLAVLRLRPCTASKATAGHPTIEETRHEIPFPVAAVGRRPAFPGPGGPGRPVQARMHRPGQPRRRLRPDLPPGPGRSEGLRRPGRSDAHRLHARGHRRRG